MMEITNNDTFYIGSMKAFDHISWGMDNHGQLHCSAFDVCAAVGFITYMCGHWAGMFWEQPDITPVWDDIAKELHSYKESAIYGIY